MTAAAAAAAVMDQETPDFSVDTVKLYLQEEGLSVFNRIRSKILGTGIGAGSAGAPFRHSLIYPDLCLCCLTLQLL
jgi:hypothetical protein